LDMELEGLETRDIGLQSGRGPVRRTARAR
jgi:hypothetical protein